MREMRSPNSRTRDQMAQGRILLRRGAQGCAGDDAGRVENRERRGGPVDQQRDLGAGERDRVAAVAREIANDLLKVFARRGQKLCAYQLVVNDLIDTLALAGV